MLHYAIKWRPVTVKMYLMSESFIQQVFIHLFQIIFLNNDFI